MKHYLLFFFTILFHCSPIVHKTVFIFPALPEKPDQCNIQIFVDQKPVCEYKEIGIIDVKQRNKFTSMDKLVAALKREACRMGGDAIINLRYGSDQTMLIDNGIVLPIEKKVITGIVVVWINPNCNK